MNINFLILILIFLFGNIIESITGFGSTIIAVTLLANFYPINYLVVIFIPLNILLSLYFVLRYYYCVDYSLLLKKIFPLTGSGLLIGILIFNTAQSQILKIAYGIFVAVFSVYELFHILKKSNRDSEQISFLKSALFLISGGIVQGIYASGGPLVVYYASKKILNKKIFRSTLSALWLFLNIFLVLNYILTDKINSTTIKTDIILLPFMIIGIVIGEWIHNRIPQRIFRIFLFLLLFVAGLFLIV
jgi:uncharacterized membrane protein YfcA